MSSAVPLSESWSLIVRLMTDQLHLVSIQCVYSYPPIEMRVTDNPHAEDIQHECWWLDV